MLARVSILFKLVLFVGCSYAQSCPDGLVYLYDSPIRVYDPSQPLSTTNPSSTTIIPPAGSNGLAYGPNLNAGSPSPTFYTVAGGLYYYWNGSGWTNTGHTTGGSIATINIAVGPGCLYNLVTGSGGQVYAYHGTGNGTLLFTIPGFIGMSPGQGAGPYDLVTDNCCNVYVMKTTSPQSIQIYSSTGASLAVCAVSGLPSSSGGNGFAIVGNQVVVYNTIGVYVGTITGSTITFTNVATNFGTGGSDLASCPISCNSTCFTTLPISFRSFNCETNDNGYNALIWETEMETNISFYSIERSVDGINFFEIGKVMPMNKAWKYKFGDETVANNVYYYRVTANERSGTKKSTAICFSAGSNKPLNSSAVFPNPGSGEVSVYVSSKKQTPVEIRLYDKCGKLTRSFMKSTEGEAQKINLDVSDLSSGIYIFELSSNNETISRQKLSIIN